MSPGVEITLPTISLTEVNRPELASTVHTTYTATTSMMPAAIENRNDVFITDHGSRRDSRNRALRVRRATPAFPTGPAARVSAPFAEGWAAVGDRATPAAAATAGMITVLGPWSPR